MQAAEQGDTAQVERFTPMALGAYAQLDTINVDARYHAAVLRLQVGDAGRRAGAGRHHPRAEPGPSVRLHRARAPRPAFRATPPRARRAGRDFLSHYDAEIEGRTGSSTASTSRPSRSSRRQARERQPHDPHHPRRPQPRLRRRVHVLRAGRGQDRHRRPPLRPRAVGHRVAEPAGPPGGARGDRGLDPRLRLPLARLRPARLGLLDGRRLRPPAGGHAPTRRRTRARRSGASASACPAS